MNQSCKICTRREQTASFPSPLPSQASSFRCFSAATYNKRPPCLRAGCAFIRPYPEQRAQFRPPQGPTGGNLYPKKASKTDLPTQPRPLICRTCQPRLSKVGFLSFTCAPYSGTARHFRTELVLAQSPPSPLPSSPPVASEAADDKRVPVRRREVERHHGRRGFPHHAWYHSLAESEVRASFGPPLIGQSPLRSALLLPVVQNLDTFSKYSRSGRLRLHAMAGHGILSAAMAHISRSWCQ